LTSGVGGAAGLALLALGVGLVDGINPSTVVPALLLALRSNGLRLVCAFGAAVAAVSTVVGAAVVLGPARLLVDHMPHLGSQARHVAALCIGAILVVAAALTWAHRGLASRAMASPAADSPATAAALGAGIMLVELPTAFPYVAVLAAIAASHRPPATQLGLVALFNLAFAVPLIAIAVARLAIGSAAPRALARVAEGVARYAPAALAAALAVAGSVLLVIGASGAFTR
jgi:hypothetical protein